MKLNETLEQSQKDLQELQRQLTQIQQVQNNTILAMAQKQGEINLLQKLIQEEKEQKEKGNG